jgi:SAM-dependent methyltransferase
VVGATTVAARAELARLPAGSHVLDAACGIGIDALVLHRKGHRVTATDASPAMVARARDRFTTAGAEIPSAVVRWDELADRWPGSFDAVLCTGNALAHLVDDAEVATALVGLRTALRPGGVLLVDAHDWDAVRTAASRSWEADPVTRDGTTATCAYRWRLPREPDHPHVLDVEISLLDATRGETTRTHTVTLRPSSRERVRDWLRSAGFRRIRVEADRAGDRYTAIARAD